MSSMSVWRVRLRGRELRRAAHARPARLAGRGQHRPRGRAALRARPQRRRAATSRPPRAARRLDAGRRVDAAGARSSCPGRIVGTPPGAAVDTLARARAAACPRRPRRVARSSTTSPATTTCRPRGTLTLAGGRRVRYTGQVLAPEYFIVTAPGADFGAESAFAVVFAPLRTAQALAGPAGPRQPARRCACAPAPTPPRVAQASRGALRAALPATGFTFTTRDQEPAHRLIYKDAEGDQQMLDIFAFLLLGAATFAAFNLISRTVEAQRREIGIGMALGVRAAGARPPPVPARRADRARRRRARHPGRPRRRRVARGRHGPVLPAAGRASRLPVRPVRPGRGARARAAAARRRGAGVARGARHADRGDPRRRARRAQQRPRPGWSRASACPAAPSRTCRCATCCARRGARS